MSNINPNSINITFPVAGQDNNSQGFRDNFANTATNFTFAASEITDLQNKAILKSALTGGTLNNNFQGALLSNAVTAGFADLILDLGVVSGAVSINATTASFQRITTAGPTTVSFAGFPAAGNYGKLRLEIIVTNVSYTLTIPSTVTLGTTGINGLSANVITFPAVGNYLYEFSTFDGAGSFFIVDLLQNRTALNGNLSITGNISATGSISGGAASVINANVTPIGSQAATIVGTMLRLVNLDTDGTRLLIEAYNSTGMPPGVTNRTARGTAAGPTATQAADLIGTFTAHGYGATAFSAASTGMVAFVADGGSFTDTSQPTAISFQTTKSASVTKSEAMRIFATGQVAINGTAGSTYTGITGTNNTSGTLVVTGDVGVSGTLRVGNVAENVVTKTTTYSFGATDGTVFANGTGGNFAVTTPNAAASGQIGRIIRIVKTDNTSTITITSGGGTLVGANSLTGTAGTATARATYQSDGTNWQQIA
jgi:hypothetical protein